MNGIKHAIQFLSNDHHFPSSGAKSEAKEILQKLKREHKSLTKEAKIKEAMGHYLSDDESDYDNIIEALREALKDEPETMIDHIEFPNQDGINVDSINVWEKVQLEFTVREFCDLVGIK